MTKKKAGTTKPAANSDQNRQRAMAQADNELKRLDAEERGGKKPRVHEVIRGDGRKVKVTVPVDEPTKTAKPAKAAKAPKPKKEKRPSGLDLAADAVAKAREPINAKTIAERAIAAGWKTSGKTPHATLYAAIIREIAEKGKDARFKKTDRGLFTANTSGGKKA